MATRINVRPLGRFARFADALMVPIMYVVSGTFREVPQQTHRWNNSRLKSCEIAHLENSMMANCDGGMIEARFRCIPFFHMPIFGGWKKYVVLAPGTCQQWHVGWIAKDVIGVSRINLRGPVRMLVGSGAVSFFGVTTEGEQISVREIAQGTIGERGPYARIPLL